jgi:polysaccharide biosynthesis transport protein
VQVLPIDLPTQSIYPKPLANAGLGAVAGLGFAIALIIIFEWIEDHLARPEEVRELLGLKILTIVPRLSRKQYRRPPVETPALAERYRILSANLIAVQEVKPFKLVMVTSAVINEGKSTIAANLASFLAMAGKQVLLIDANLYRPVLDQRFQLDNHVGLSTVFLDMWASPRAELYGQPTNISTLHVLTAGKVPSESPEMLQSPLANRLFEYFKHTPFDYIIFDAPPLLPVADAQILASLVEAIVLVVDADKTSRRVLRRVRSVLDDLHTTILGVAINKSPWADDRTIRQYANHIWQPQKGNIMLQNIAPPLYTASSPDTQRLSVKDRPLKPPRSLIHTPAPTNGAVYSDTAIISDPQQAVMNNQYEMDTRNMIQGSNNEKIS